MFIFRMFVSVAYVHMYIYSVNIVDVEPQIDFLYVCISTILLYCTLHIHL